MSQEPNLYDAWVNRREALKPVYEWTDIALLLMGFTGAEDPRVAELEPPDREWTLEELLTESWSTDAAD